MAKKKNKKVKSKNLSDLGGLVYSTNPDQTLGDQLSDALNNEQTDPSQQTLYVSRDKKGRGGKVATLVEGFQGDENELVELGKSLKQKCGVGGSAKDGEIIIQGDKRDRVAELLEKEGFKVKLKGG